MRHVRSTTTWVLLFLIVAVLSLRPLVAQVANSGTVLGTVTDASGAALPEVSITLRNPASNLTMRMETEGSGEFRFLTVPAGTYELTAEKQGFNKVVHSAFEVHAAEPARVDVVLAVGAVAQEITVTAAPVSRSRGAARAKLSILRRCSGACVRRRHISESGARPLRQRDALEGTDHVVGTFFSKEAFVIAGPEIPVRSLVVVVAVKTPDAVHDD